MTAAVIQQGFLYPEVTYADTLGGGANTGTMDAAGEKYALIGQLFIEGRPAGAKTLSTGKIWFRTGTCVFADVATTLDIGIQDVAIGAGPIAQPDGTFDVKTTLTGGAGLTTVAVNSPAMTSGTKSMTHGDLIAVVFDMTARGGTDSVTVLSCDRNIVRSADTQLPVTNAYIAAAWQTAATVGAGRVPNVAIEFDDGTLGWLDMAPAFTAIATELFSDSTNPDERGLIFQVPWDCKIDELWAICGRTDANSDFTLKLYSDPLGTPTLLASVAVLAENMGAATTQGFFTGLLASQISLTKNTDYAVTLLATGTSNARLATNTFFDEKFRKMWNGGTTVKKATRDGSTGAFTAETPAVTMPRVGVRIYSLDDGTGTGSGGGLKLAGRGGLAG